MERPKAGPRKHEMRDNLAGGARASPTTHVNVKATTGEGMGFVGREEGVAAQAVATVRED